MREINLSADDLIAALLNLEKERNLCLLDSCGVSHLDSHLLIAGINPLEILEINESSAEETLSILEKKLSRKDLAAMLTISYEFGLKLNKIPAHRKESFASGEADIFLALFDVLIVHDYNRNKTFLTGEETKYDEIERILVSANSEKFATDEEFTKTEIYSNYTRREYLAAVEKVQELIRSGDIYQTNLTHQIRAALPSHLKPEKIFAKLRRENPAPFAAFFRRANDTVISASPERFFKVQNVNSKAQNYAKDLTAQNHSLEITVSPIKGTRPRGKTPKEDDNLRSELLNSEKDRAENVMIVDLLRNDIGRICEYGSVTVEKLCDLEEHPTLFHLVSTVSGKLRPGINLSAILRAVFPCGSITGAPKIRTMRIIDEIETAPRNLSMGAIGFIIQDSKFGIQNLSKTEEHFAVNKYCLMDFSVAIRTMVISEDQAVFNVGGGITIDSIPAEEYEETLVKAKALLSSINGKTKV